MHPLRKTIINYRSICWVLVVALVLTLLLPAHYHLHHLHDADLAEHAHVLDLHLIADTSGHAHHHEDTSIFSATPDAIVKSDKSFVYLFMPLAVFLLLLLAFPDRGSQRRDRDGIGLVRYNTCASPPSRAPPTR